MSGQPQLREAGRLYGPEDPDVPIAVVRLEERMDGSGLWDLYLNDPATEQRPQHWTLTEDRAWAELARVYEWGAVDGEWRKHRPKPG